ncbi:MAG TPA: antibiotic biosynthesis monooxygenase [Actinomycetota bacterium]|nr:antibiotic biosynthesis monooxygenase [Actinomycetota bacterium]
MSYVVINAIEVPEDAGPQLEERFANRAGEVSKADGFESFFLLRPDNDAAAGRYFVFTKWASKEAFEAWMASRAFTQGHKGASERPVGTGSQVLAYEVIQSEEV